MQVNMVVERRAEAMQKGDAAESRAGGGGGVGVNRYDCRSAQQSLDLGKKDFREGRDGWGSVGKRGLAKRLRVSSREEHAAVEEESGFRSSQSAATTTGNQCQADQPHRQRRRLGDHRDLP